MAMMEDVTRGLDPRVHLLRKNAFCEGRDGLNRNSGLPELRNIMRRKSGKTRLAVSSPAMTARDH